jgi:hypothetical protein
MCNPRLILRIVFMQDGTEAEGTSLLCLFNGRQLRAQSLGQVGDPGVVMNYMSAAINKTRESLILQLRIL